MSEWRETTTEEVIAPQKGSLISGPFGSNISSKYFVNDGIPVIRGNNLSLDIGTKFIDRDFVFITQNKAEELNTWAIENDIIFTAAGTIGQIGIIKNTYYDKYIISNKQIRLRIDITKALPVYIYYWFASPQMVEKIISMDTGSTIPLINLSVVRQLPLLLPPLPEQCAIAEVLSSFDDKIDLLTRQNATLEALAQTYFRQWFVDCEPSTPLGKIFNFVNGFAFKGSTYELDGEYRIITIKNVQDGEIDPKGASFITEIPKGMNDKCKLSIGDVLISLTGNVGRVGIVTDSNLLLNQRVAKFQPNDDKLLPYFYFLFRQNDMKTYLESIAKGTAQQNLSPVETLKTLIAFEEELVCEYIKIADPLFKKIIANKCQIQTLQKLRDTLLPKLISGEVRVN